MAQREQKTKPRPAKAETATEETTVTSHKSGAELKQELDDLLDEIDEVLEENAADFVRDYVQKGGQ